MRAQDFTSERAGQVVTCAGAQGAYQAFLPQPLPPAVQWTSSLAKLVSQATLALGRLGGIGERLENPHLLIRPFMRREAVLSSRIEGTQASLSDLFLFEAAPTATPAVPDVREVRNYVVALEHALAQPGAPVGLRLIRDLHARLMAGVRGHDQTPGEFRDVQNWIGPWGCSLRDATFVPPPPAVMREALEAFERYLRAPTDLPYLVRLAAIHYQFETIHPFRDGNGRVGRLLVTVLLCTDRQLPDPLLYLSAYFERHRFEYYDHLLAVSQRGAWEEWIAFFLRGVSEQATDAIARAARLDELRRDYYRRVQSARTSSLILRLIDELFGIPMISAPKATKLLGVTPRAANESIKKLIAAGILEEVTGKERGRVYAAREIMRAVEAPLDEDEPAALGRPGDLVTSSE